MVFSGRQCVSPLDRKSNATNQSNQSMSKSKWDLNELLAKFWLTSCASHRAIFLLVVIVNFVNVMFWVHITWCRYESDILHANLLVPFRQWANERELTDESEWFFFFCDVLNLFCSHNDNAIAIIKLGFMPNPAQPGKHTHTHNTQNTTYELDRILNHSNYSFLYLCRRRNGTHFRLNSPSASQENLWTILCNGTFHIVYYEMKHFIQRFCLHQTSLFFRFAPCCCIVVVAAATAIYQQVNEHFLVARPLEN